MTQAELQAVAKVLGDIVFGFTDTEIGRPLAQYGFVDTDSTIAKHKRLYNSFCERYNREQSLIVYLCLFRMV